MSDVARRKTAASGWRRVLLAGCGVVTLLIGAVVVPPIGGGHAEEPPAEGATDPAAAVEPSPDEQPVDAPATTDPQTAEPPSTTPTMPTMPTMPEEPSGPTDPAPADLPADLPADGIGRPPPDSEIASADATPLPPDGPSVTPEATTPSPTFTPAALASTGLSIRLTDPLMATPVELDLGPRVQRVDASAFVTIVNDTGREVTLDIDASGAVSRSENGTCGIEAFLPATTGFNFCEIEIVIDTSNEGQISGGIEIFDSTPGAPGPFVEIPVIATVFSGAPPNDDVANATDLSGVTIPPYVAGPSGAPRDTVAVSGTNEGATLEDGERTDLGERTVWYRFTSPSGGFAGRLGYRVSATHRVQAFSDACGFTVTFVDQCDALGDFAQGSLPTDFVRMQPGTTVWFAVDSSPIGAPGAPFVFELFQAPNPSDDITLAEEPGRGLGTGIQPGALNLSLDGDTYHLTADNGARPNRWVTFVLNQPGDVTVEIETGDALSATTGTGPDIPVRLFAAPDRNRVTSPAALGDAIAEGVVHRTDFGTPAGRTLLEATNLEPGRYYVEISEGDDGPGFHTGRLFLPAGTGGDVDPPTVTITTPTDGAVFEEPPLPELVLVEATCTDNVDGTTQADDNAIKVDLESTNALALAVGEHTVEVTCTDTSGNTAIATVRYTVVTRPVTPVISISGPARADIGDEEPIAVTVSHPGSGAAPISAGFRFRLNAPFSEEILGVETPPPGVTCEEVIPFEDDLGCRLTAPLDVGESVTVTFITRAPTNTALSPCERLDASGQRFTRTDFAGTVCLNAIAYPGERDINAVNRTRQGGDAHMASIPLDGPYLRFDATASDAAPGEVTVLRITPRNPGTDTLIGPELEVFGEPEATWLPGQLPAGWECRQTSNFFRQVACKAPALSIDSRQSGATIELSFTAPPLPSPSTCPFTIVPIVDPPDPCGIFSISWASPTSSIVAQTTAYRIGGPPPPPPSGPCVIVRTADVEFGQVELGSDGEAPVTIESCSGADVDLTVTVSDATSSGSSETWVASTSTTPPNDGQFRWTVTPEGGAESDPVGPGTARSIGSLAASAERTDTHRIRLGPSGPGLGRTFSSTITYTAMTTTTP